MDGRRVRYEPRCLNYNITAILTLSLRSISAVILSADCDQVYKRIPRTRAVYRSYPYHSLKLSTNFFPRVLSLIPSTERTLRKRLEWEFDDQIIHYTFYQFTSPINHAGYSWNMTKVFTSIWNVLPTSKILNSGGKPIDGTVYYLCKVTTKYFSFPWVLQ